MLIVEVNEKQTIERALKVLKRKWDKTKTLKELRDRKHPNDVRTMCIPCHDAQVERARVVKIIDSPSNLIEFFINEESDNYGTLFVGREVSSTDD